MYTIESLFRALADKASHGGYELQLLCIRSRFGQFVLINGKDRIHFALEVDGNKVNLWEGKDVSVNEMIPQSFTNVTPLGILAVLLRYRLYHMLDGKMNF